ncbi:FG-GAP repeat domain-containing protein [Nannocystis radixulma]|uniref:VCBS repeat-containing protein n=1 Tax=Nannocystis radixulma TaxID=2995305 RepID=A0ABT5B3G9_9BACT|nr:VCBS repeat-containing protein [Nannocystis radixulma]MDC0668084.1 VCBS repeat-containing protein [Nannocystis radixulma]
MTLLCGLPAGCCDAGEECMSGACVAACASGVRCGADDSLCCGEGEVCLDEACQLPLGACEDSSECEAEQFCDPSLGQCLPQPDQLGCEPGPIEVALEWEWTTDQVVTTPMIADVDDDGVPDVILSITAGEGVWRTGELVLLDGTTGAEKWRIAHEPGNMKFGALGRSTVGVGDVSGDGVPDIIYAGRAAENPTLIAPIHAVDGQGQLLWTAHLANDEVVRVKVDNAAVMVANLDDDPEAEVALGAMIIDHDGLVVWNPNNNGVQVGTPLNNNTPIYFGGLSTVADLDGDDKPELVTGREAWKIDWVAGDPPTVTLSEFWANDMNPVVAHNNDGWPSVADLDGDGKPEVVLTAWPAIRVINGQTGQLWCGVDPTDAECTMNPALRTQPIPIKGGNLGGPATIADFDGDGRPEAAITGGTAFAVYDFNRPGEQVVKPNGDPMPKPGAMYARWTAKTQDNSSAATGASAFDFQGDGAAEVLQQDECFARVFDGATGALLLEIMNSSSTIHEYPLVADVDGDGASELMMVANLGEPQNVYDCTARTPDFTPRKGVFVYRAQAGNWPSTRNLWTQHTYHGTNADADGNPPFVEQDHWTVPGFNSFRQSTTVGSFHPADLTLSLAADVAQCPAEFVLVASIHNAGSLGAPAGVDVSFYEGLNDSGTLLGTVATSEAIVPGGSTQVTLAIAAPPADMPANFFAVIDPGADGGVVQECLENNNDAILTQAACAE